MKSFLTRSQNRTSDTIIYLPLPLGLLREEAQPTWVWREFEIMVKQVKLLLIINNK